MEMRNGQGAVSVIFGWECNRRSGITVTTCHRLCHVSTYGLNEYPAYDAVMVLFTFLSRLF